MKKKMIGLVVGLMLIGVNLFAADGDLTVNGTTTTTDLIVNGTITTGGQKFRIQYNQAQVNVNLAPGTSSAYAPVTFAVPFKAETKPRIILSGTAYGSGLVALVASATDISATQFTPRIYNSHTGNVRGTYTFDWIAIGE